MPAFGQPTRLEQILEVIESRIVSSLSLPATSVFSSLTDDDSLFTGAPYGDTFVVVVPESFSLDQGHFTGAGNTGVIWNGSIRVSLFTRLGLDLTTRDSRFLKDASLGVLAKWRLIFKALSEWAPPTSLLDPTRTFVEPMRCSRFRTAPRRSARSEWGKLESVWETRYRQDLS